MNPLKLMQMKETMDRFTAAHPKVLPFFRAVSGQALAEGTVIEMKVTTPEGKAYLSSIRLTQEDLKLIQEMKEGLL